MMEFYKQSWSRARKEHICEFCGQSIHKGETYSYETGKYDGDLFVRKLHRTCKNILDEFCRDNGENEFSWDWVSEWLGDLFCPSCEQGSGGEDRCRLWPQNCPMVREKFGEGKDDDNYDTTNQEEMV